MNRLYIVTHWYMGDDYVEEFDNLHDAVDFAWGIEHNTDGCVEGYFVADGDQWVAVPQSQLDEASRRVEVVRRLRSDKRVVRTQYVVKIHAPGASDYHSSHTTYASALVASQNIHPAYHPTIETLEVDA